MEHDAKGILERILTSYGVRSRPELAAKLGIPLSTIQNWVSRNSLPGDYVVQCMLDTGADLKWLMSGELKNLDFTSTKRPLLKGQNLHEQILASGGKVILQRILHAYGFSMQKELGDHLGIGSGTISAWIRREYFPGDVVITCALETGASLSWLATGIDENYNEKNISSKNIEAEIIKIPKASIVAGRFVEDGHWYADKMLLSNSEKINDFYCVTKGTAVWVADFGIKTISNGTWLLNIDGNHDIYEVKRIPGNQVEFRQVNDSSSHNCSVDEIKAVGMIVLSVVKL